MTKLTAVNRMLEALAEPPATGLDTGGTSLVARAEAMLDTVDTEIQEQGWAANTAEEVEFTPDGSDQINLNSQYTATVLRISTAPTSRHLDVSIRNGYLYDRKEDRDTWPDVSTVTLKVVSQVTFTELSPALARYIAQAAAVRFQRATKRGVTDEQLQQRELLECKVRAEREDHEFRRPNFLHTAGAERVRGGRRAHWGLS